MGLLMVLVVVNRRDITKGDDNNGIECSVDHSSRRCVCVRRMDENEPEKEKGEKEATGGKSVPAGM